MVWFMTLMIDVAALSYIYTYSLDCIWRIFLLRKSAAEKVLER
jgi:hypothetical protein